MSFWIRKLRNGFFHHLPPQIVRHVGKLTTDEKLRKNTNVIAGEVEKPAPHTSPVIYANVNVTADLFFLNIIYWPVYRKLSPLPH